MSVRMNEQTRSLGNDTSVVGCSRVGAEGKVSLSRSLSRSRRHCKSGESESGGEEW